MQQECPASSPPRPSPWPDMSTAVGRHRVVLHLGTIGVLAHSPRPQSTAMRPASTAMWGADHPRRGYKGPMRRCGSRVATAGGVCIDRRGSVCKAGGCRLGRAGATLCQEINTQYSHTPNTQYSPSLRMAAWQQPDAPHVWYHIILLAPPYCRALPRWGPRLRRK